MNIVTVASCITYPEKEDQYLTSNSYDFHKALGFKEVARFPHIGYKFDSWYSMVWMVKDINTPEHNMKDIIPFKKISK